MLKIRLARIGRKNDPTFRIVVTESTRGPKTGRHIEILGNYNPKLNAVSVDGERVTHWIGNGAQVSDTVHNILVGQKVIEGKKVNVLPRKSPIKKEGEEGEAAPAETPAAEAPTSEEVAPAASGEAPEAKEETAQPEESSEEKKEA